MANNPIEKIKASPERYLEIPDRDHGEHHDILQDFLSSNWTDDEELWTRARQAYSGSIGRWKQEVEKQDVVHSYYEFRDRKVKELAEEFSWNTVLGQLGVTCRSTSQPLSTKEGTLVLKQLNSSYPTSPATFPSRQG